jgi:hypothetical protein
MRSTGSWKHLPDHDADLPCPTGQSAPFVQGPVCTICISQYGWLCCSMKQLGNASLVCAPCSRIVDFWGSTDKSQSLSWMTVCFHQLWAAKLRSSWDPGVLTLTLLLPGLSQWADQSVPWSYNQMRTGGAQR